MARMIRHNRYQPILLIAALAMLALRALTPDGYMPGSQGSGLLYELCPSGMPAEIMRALAGGGHDPHRHHHSGGDGEASVSGTEQCPIGHMLGSAIAADTSAEAELLPDAPALEAVPVVLRASARAAVYRSRAPPA